MAERLHFALLCILYFLEFLLISYICSNMRKYKSLILFTFRQSTINNRKKTTRHDYKNIKKKERKILSTALCQSAFFIFSFRNCFESHNFQLHDLHCTNTVCMPIANTYIHKYDELCAVWMEMAKMLCAVLYL